MCTQTHLHTHTQINTFGPVGNCFTKPSSYCVRFSAPCWPYSAIPSRNPARATSWVLAQSVSWLRSYPSATLIFQTHWSTGSSLNTPDCVLSLCLCPSCSLSLEGPLFCPPRGYLLICQDSAHGKPFLAIKRPGSTNLALLLLPVFEAPWTDCYLRTSTLFMKSCADVCLPRLDSKFQETWLVCFAHCWHPGGPK